MGIHTTADDYNELGISHYLRAQQAKTSRERRAAWALALAAWRQGLDRDPNHLFCQFNRLHALLALGSQLTAVQEGKELLSRLLTQRYLEDPNLGLSGSELRLAWDPPSWPPTALLPRAKKPALCQSCRLTSARPAGALPPHPGPLVGLSQWRGLPT